MPPSSTPPPTRRNGKADNEVLIKGLTCALIGLIILLTPYVKPEGNVSQMLAQVRPVGWFSLVLGLAFILLFGVRRWQKRA